MVVDLLARGNLRSGTATDISLLFFMVTAGAAALLILWLMLYGYAICFACGAFPR